MKLNFFARIYLAITDFRLYPFIAQKEKFISAFAYFLCFILLVAAILSTGVAAKIINWTSEFLTVYDSKVNEFTISDGILDMSENTEFDFLNVKIYTDDTKTMEEFDFESFDLEDNKFSIIALKDTFAIANSNVGMVLAKYADFNMNMTKESTYIALEKNFGSPVFRISLTMAIFGGVFVAYLLTKFLNVIGISIMLLFLGFIFKTSYKFKDYMKVAFYVITLPIIVEIIGLMVTGEITDYAYITYYLLVYVYMYYAIRALKLDNIIMATQEKLMGMKMENDITNDNAEEKNDEDVDNDDKQQK